MTKCSYCNKKCRKVEWGSFQNNAYQCDYHGSVRVIEIDNGFELKKTILSVIYKSNNYHAIFFYKSDTPEKFRIDKVNRPPKTHQTIVSLDFHPDLTPENIMAKFPTLLMFS